MQDKAFKVFLAIAILGLVLQVVGLVGGIVASTEGCYRFKVDGELVSTNCTPEQLAKMDKRRLKND